MKKIIYMLLLPLLLHDYLLSNTLINNNQMLVDKFDDEFNDEFDEEFLENTEEENDPLYVYNNWMTDINVKIYDYALIPVVKTYNYILPIIVRDKIVNFFDNLNYPLSLISNILQLKIKNSGTETLRFVLNTTIGIGGLFDPATKLFNIEKKSEDLGQVLGYYGLGNGFHIVLPLLGPSNLRDLTGDIINWIYNPIYYSSLNSSYSILKNSIQSTSLNIISKISNSANNLNYYENIISTKNSKYIELKSFYEQNRNKLIKE